MSFEKEIGEAAFKEKPDIEGAFIRQIDRTNQAAMLDPDLHQTLTMLPSKWRAWVYAQDDRYTNYDPRWIFKTYQGHDIGTEEEPMLRDDSKPVRRHEDGSIDWTDPNIYSPKLDTTPPPINFQAFNELIMEAAELASLTWQPRGESVDAGSIKKVKKLKKKK